MQLERERSTRTPYLSVQRAVFAEPMLHFRNDRSPEGAALRTEGTLHGAACGRPSALSPFVGLHRQSQRVKNLTHGVARFLRWWAGLAVSAVLAASGQWLDFYDAYGKRYWYNLLSHEVSTDVEAIRAPSCALTIQRIWRGYLVRRELYDQHHAALRIGGFWRGVLYRRNLHTTRAARVAAAVRIQRFWRRVRAAVRHSHALFMRLAEVGQRVGLARRRRLLTLGLQASGRTYRGVCREVTFIQRAYRAYGYRCLLYDPDGRKTAAAVMMQRHVRRFQSRLVVNAMRQVHDHQRELARFAAAKTIQRAYRLRLFKRKVTDYRGEMVEQTLQQREQARQERLQRVMREDRLRRGRIDDSYDGPLLGSPSASQSLPPMAPPDILPPPPMSPMAAAAAAVAAASDSQ